MHEFATTSGFNASHGVAVITHALLGRTVQSTSASCRTGHCSGRGGRGRGGRGEGGQQRLTAHSTPSMSFGEVLPEGEWRGGEEVQYGVLYD